VSKKRKKQSAAHRSGIPQGALAADVSKQVVPYNACCPPLKSYYEDIEFTCCDCGRQEVWKAKQQKWYYEMAGGSIYNKASRCRECRKKNQAMKERQCRKMIESDGREKES